MSAWRGRASGTPESDPSPRLRAPQTWIGRRPSVGFGGSDPPASRPDGRHTAHSADSVSACSITVRVARSCLSGGWTCLRKTRLTTKPQSRPDVLANRPIDQSVPPHGLDQFARDVAQRLVAQHLHLHLHRAVVRPELVVERELVLGEPQSFAPGVRFAQFPKRVGSVPRRPGRLRRPDSRSGARSGRSRVALALLADLRLPALSWSLGTREPTTRSDSPSGTSTCRRRSPPRSPWPTSHRLPVCSRAGRRTPRKGAPPP